MFHFALFRGTNKLCVHLEKKKVLLASMKVKFPLSALIFFLFLAYLTHPGKRDGKSFPFFRLYSCFLFRRSLKNCNPTLLQNAFFSLWIFVFLNKSCSFYSLNERNFLPTKMSWIIIVHRES